MIDDKKVIAVVPARSGSKGVKDKNMAQIGGQSLIALAGQTLNESKCDFIDRRLLSTDSDRYAEEGTQHGLECPFLRPDSLSGDKAGAIETMIQVWEAAEEHYNEVYDILLIVEPTCPLRKADDILGTAQKLVQSHAESAVSVSLVDSKYHPDKILNCENDQLTFYSDRGAGIQSRQELRDLYYRNGACYAITKTCLIEKKRIFSDHTVAYVVDRPLANIDTLLDLQFANFMSSQA